jgi:hypothetical protein
VDRTPGRGDAIAILDVRHIRQRLSQFHRFIVVLPVGGAVTTADDRHMQTGGLKSLSEPLHHRCFTCSTEREIANRDNRDIDIVNFRGAAIIAPITHFHYDRVRHFGDSQQAARERCQKALPSAADEVSKFARSQHE